MAGDVATLAAHGAELALPAPLRVMLASAYADAQPGPAAAGLVAAAAGNADTAVPYALVTDPAASDVIVFVEYHPGHDPYFFDVLRHPLRRQYPRKCVLYTDVDRLVPLMPTLGPSIERWQYHPALCRPFPYVTREYRNDAIERHAPLPAVERRYLFSFAGSSDTHPVRQRILALRVPEALLIDTGAQRAWQLQADDKVRYEARYYEACRDSRFVLCPRGAGPSSYRLYETMQLGRAPVVISDSWVPHEGPDWDSFCVRVRERDVGRLPRLLQDRAGDSAAMGLRARREWERWVAPPVALHRLVAAAAELAGVSARWHHGLLRWAQFAHPFHLRNLGRYLVRLRHLRP